MMMGTLAIHAADYTYLTFETTDGAKASVSVENMTLTISGGTLNLTATGSGGKGMKCDGVMTISDGTINVTTSGYNGEDIESKNYLTITGGH